MIDGLGLGEGEAAGVGLGCEDGPPVAAGVAQAARTKPSRAAAIIERTTSG